MKPLVSILIPAYNSQQWLAEAIKSALAQTWPQTEVIVVDDGSHDATLQVARQFESSTVKIISQANQGAAVARNTAYAMCQGEYVQWLDADDLLEPDKIARQLQRIRDEGDERALVSGAWGYFRYRARKTQFSSSGLWADLTPVEWLYRKMGQNLHMQTDNWLVSRALSDAAGPWDSRLSHDDDGEYFCRVILASTRILFVPDAKSYYRRSGTTSLSYIGGSTRKLESLFMSMSLHIKYLRSMEDSERTRAACVQYIRNWLFEFYPSRRDLGNELIAVAEELGGHNVAPHLSKKYHWIADAFGWGAARRAQFFVPNVKQSAMNAWDRALYRFEAGMARGIRGATVSSQTADS